ncbi:serine hydrolase domain-containing protein [Duganella guangzhouensis]|uniref:serine hydrolase domain-containing protein n=1 Tax=Duganella guangzhouensis TaxID=2666084 RepID=UPI0018A1C56A|nr:serine hydrolase domain-containing protein [Duganella guangzhouensis]
MDKYVQSELERAHMPGGALVVVDRTGIVHLQGFGVSGPSGARPGPDTMFQIGSNAKSLTALAIMQQVEAGKLQLDAPLQRYLPWFRVADASASAQITLRHLLNQTSGLPHSEGEQDFAATDDGDGVLERLVRQLADVKLASPPGQRWAYSNINFVVLGCVLEAVSGERYADYLQRHVFTPLGMGHSVASERFPPGAEVATGHRYWFGRPVAADGLPFPPVLAPAGYVYSSARDMGGYLRAHLGRSAVLGVAGLDELHRKGANTGQRYGYAMGWATDSELPAVLTHEGGTPGYTSAMGINVEQGWGYALLLNGSDIMTGGLVTDLGPQIAKFMSGQQPSPRPASRALAPAVAMLCALLAIQVMVALVMLHFRRWLGRVAFAAAGIAGVALAGGLLLVVPARQQISLSGILLFAPDAGWLLVANAVLALAGAAAAILSIRAGRA